MSDLVGSPVDRFSHDEAQNDIDKSLQASGNVDIDCGMHFQLMSFNGLHFLRYKMISNL